MPQRTAEYDYEASAYEKSRFHSRLGMHLDHVHKKIVAGLISSNGKILLDVGIGTGRLATWLAEKGFEVVGVDVSKEMLKEAKRKTKSLSENVHLVLGDGHFLPFKKEVFDGCICINVVNHIPQIDRFLKEVQYTIEPRGFFVVNFPNLQSLYFPIAIIVNLRKHALLKRRTIRSRWFTPLEIKRLIRNAGFNVKEVKTCAITSSIPLGDKLVRIIERVNLLLVDSRLKHFGGSLFISADVCMKRQRSCKPFMKMK